MRKPLCRAPLSFSQVDRDFHGALQDAAAGKLSGANKRKRQEVEQATAATRKDVTFRQRAWLGRGRTSAREGWRPRKVQRRAAMRFLLNLDNQGVGDHPLAKGARGSAGGQYAAPMAVVLRLSGLRRRAD